MVTPVAVRSGLREKKWELMRGILVLGWVGVVGVCRTGILLWSWQENRELVKGRTKEEEGILGWLLMLE